MLASHFSIVLRRFVLIALFVALGTIVNAAQKQPAKKGKDKPPKNSDAGKTGTKKPPVKKGDALAEWKSLNEQRRKIGRELRELRIEFEIADRKRKLEIKQIFDAGIKRWNDEIRPKMVERSLARLEHEPDDRFAGELARETTDVQQIDEVTRRILKSGRDTGPVLYLAGEARFKLNRFSEALDLLERARDKNVDVERYFLDRVKDYVKFWQREQELRKKERAAKPADRLPRVKIETSEGNILLELFENEAPNTVANFISLVEKKYYDGQRVYGTAFRSDLPIPLSTPQVPVVLIGDEDTKKDFKPEGKYGTILPKYTIKSEAFEENARMHFRGSLSIEAASKDDGYSDFAILRQPMPGRNPSGLQGYTVFGRVKEGMDVVDKLQKGDKIVKMTVEFKRNHPYKPKTSLDKEPPKKEPGKTGKKPDGKKRDGKKPDGKKPSEKKPSDKKSRGKTKS